MLGAGSACRESAGDFGVGQAGGVDPASPRRDLPLRRRGQGLGRAVAREFGIGWLTAMTAVSDYGTPRVDDPIRLHGVDVMGLDETVSGRLATRS